MIESKTEERPKITFDWTPHPGHPRRIVMKSGAFEVDGEETTDLERVLSAVKDLAAHLVEGDPALETVELSEKFYQSFHILEDERMRFEADGSIYLDGKFVEKDLTTVSIISGFIAKNQVRP